MFRRVEARAYVEQLDVLPDFAGRRIGAALLDAVAERARAAGLEGLSLSTFREVPWNAPYYRRLGFVEAAALTPGMLAIRAEHLARGLDEDARVFMVRGL
jgi:GNAT superfamily N-acetyltransferase